MGSSASATDKGGVWGNQACGDLDVSIHSALARGVPFPTFAAQASVIHQLTAMRTEAWPRFHNR